MLIIPTSPVPAQILTAVLADQACRIRLYTTTLGLFIDLYVNDALIIGGVICLNTNLIVRDPYLGFTGDLACFDLHGMTDPVYTGLGTRYILGYIDAADLLI